jgi:PKD repeat protein
VAVTASATDTRFNNSNGTEATQAVTAAEYTINTPPWDPAATPVALAAADGSFNSTTEALQGSINTSGLPVGRHTVYLRARDASGTWGAVSAVFLNITDTLPPIVPAFTGSCSNLTCSFNASATTGANSYTWSFGDGTTGTGVTASRTYASAGTYTVTLTAGNGTTTASQSQTVSPTAPPVVTNVAEVENNGSLSSAQLVSANPALVSGFIASSSDQDYYRVALAPGKTLVATLTPNATSNYNLYVYNASGSLLASSTRGTGLVDTVSTSNTSATASTRYVRVIRSTGGTGSTNGRYTLQLQQ